jgi:hypothetical protein
VSRERLLEAGAEVERLMRPPDDNYYAELVERYLWQCCPPWSCVLEVRNLGPVV